MIKFIFEAYDRKLSTMRKQPPKSLKLTPTDTKFWFPTTLKFLKDVDKLGYIDSYRGGVIHLLTSHKYENEYPEAKTVYKKLLRLIADGKMFLTKDRKKAEALAQYLALIDRDRPRVLLVDMANYMDLVKKYRVVKGWYMFEGDVTPEILANYIPSTEMAVDEMISTILGLDDDSAEEDSQEETGQEVTQPEKKPEDADKDVSELSPQDYENTMKKVKGDLYPLANKGTLFGNDLMYMERALEGMMDNLFNNPRYVKLVDLLGEDDPNADPYKFAYDSLRRWQSTSGDSNGYAVTFQIAAKNVFGLSDDTLSHIQNFIDSNIIGTKFEDLVEPYEELVKEIYNRTQELLEKAGLDYVYLYRAMYWPNKFATPSNLLEALPWDGETVVDVTFTCQPMSSFTLDPAVLTEFYSKGYNVVLMARVPKQDIIAFFGTGLGCSTEHEFIVKGGSRKYKALSWIAQDYQEGPKAHVLRDRFLMSLV